MTTDINLDVENVRRTLIAWRTEHGAASPIGRRCSTAVEQLQNYAEAKRNGDPLPLQNLPALMEQTMKEIGELIAAKKAGGDHQ